MFACKAYWDKISASSVLQIFSRNTCKSYGDSVRNKDWPLEVLGSVCWCGLKTMLWLGRFWSIRSLIIWFWVMVLRRLKRTVFRGCNLTIQSRNRTLWNILWSSTARTLRRVFDFWMMCENMLGSRRRTQQESAKRRFWKRGQLCNFSLSSSLMAEKYERVNASPNISPTGSFRSRVRALDDPYLWRDIVEIWTCSSPL